MASNSELESKVKSIGHQIFSRMGNETASIFDKGWWSGQVMEWSMKNEAFKVQMFRFVDVFPSLKSAAQLARHMDEYFSGPETPAFIRVGSTGIIGAIAARALGGTIDSNIKGMAQKFIAGETARAALPKLLEMRKQGLAFTVDLLGEATVSEEESQVYEKRYEELLDTLASEASKWTPVQVIDTDNEGPIPRVNVSIKISALYSQIDAIDPELSAQKVKDRLRPLFKKALVAGAFINLDMEQYALKGLTLRIFQELLEEPDFRDYPHFGIVVQAYLKDAEADLRELIKFAKKRKKPITVRLVKGAYWDYETILAEQRGWPCPVFSNKAETDANYERLTALLLENWKLIRAAIGSHNVRSIAFALATAEQLGVPKGAFELQALYGMAEPIKRACLALGYRLRDYTPIGELLPGMAYLVRRLLENTSNEGFVRLKFAEGASADKLLAAPTAPAPAAKKPEPKRDPLATFVNEPFVDFALDAHREEMKKAITSTRKSLGDTYKIVINGKEQKSDRTLVSVNPAKPSEKVGSVFVASIADAEAAVDAARKAFPAWRDLSAEARAKYLLELAELMRRKKAELTATMVFEVGKTWREADGDVAEAIDFCEYYAREAVRLGKPRKLGKVPGEVNLYFYQPRGVAAVIAPWNFPLAILTGMVTAALVTGNTVIMKPAEQSPIIAAKLMELMRAVKIPAGVVNFLPGYGEEVGAHLVSHPHVDLIAFTGSREVGFKILEEAAKVRKGQPSLKRVICELGGKNAIVVDDDADLDEAVLGTVHSAFGFQGQKCSACSRVIVLESNADEFQKRLVAATRSLLVGLPELPSTKIGPVIDQESQQRIQRVIAETKKDLKPLLEMPVPSEGYFVGPTIFENVPPAHYLAQEEIFGPVLGVLRAKTFEEALDIANNTAYALTGGIFSRSPARIAQAQRDFRVGNLYINRGITGALVERQAFGGFKMSGVGSKAGGPDYLLQFVEPRVTTENTMRRGFAPVDEPS